jgi:hypothetical protein
MTKLFQENVLREGGAVNLTCSSIKPSLSAANSIRPYFQPLFLKGGLKNG